MPIPVIRANGVFVDDSGRRKLWMRTVGWVAAALSASYVAVLGVTAVSTAIGPQNTPAPATVAPDTSAPAPPPPTSAAPPPTTPPPVKKVLPKPVPKAVPKPVPKPSSHRRSSCTARRRHPDAKLDAHVIKLDRATSADVCRRSPRLCTTSDHGEVMRARAKRQRSPRPGWVLIAATLVMACCVLLTDGVVQANFLGDSTGERPPGRDSRVPQSVVDGGPVIDTRPTPVRSYTVPDKTIAITFDDGPDPIWTPQVLAVLRKHNVPATFFPVGKFAAAYPELIQDIKASSSELAIHTFTHPDLSTIDGDRISRELSLTQLSLIGAVGETSYLVRPPYSSAPNALDERSWNVVRKLGEEGYVTALSDVDSKDYTQPGVDAIVRNSTPPNGRGGILLMHDAGGDRSQTVEALDKLIPALQQQGYRFTTVTQAVGLPPANQSAAERDVTVGAAALVAVSVAIKSVSGLVWLAWIGGALVLLRMLILIVFAGLHRYRRDPKRWSWGEKVTEPVTVIVPAYNERECITATVRSLVASDYDVEVIVVDDGSSDGTADVVKGLGLPNVRIIRRSNGGKAAALNTGLAHASHALVVMLDGDTIVERHTIRRLVQPFADPAIGAVAGNAKVANRSKLLGRWQHIEYVIGFNIDRRVYDLWQCMPTVPGAVGAYRLAALREVGGISSDTLAEDTDLTMALCCAGWRIVYEERARAWTEAPATVRQLWRQRYRWSYGTMQSMWKHRHAVVERGAPGRFGRRGLLSLAAFQVVLPLFAPLIDLFLIFGLLFGDAQWTVTLWVTVLIVQLIGAMFAFRLEGESMRPLIWLPLQQLVYRQLMYAVLIQSVASALAGVRLRWQKLKRTGDGDALLDGRVVAGPPTSTFAAVRLPGTVLPGTVLPGTVLPGTVLPEPVLPEHAVPEPALHKPVAAQAAPRTAVPAGSNGHQAPRTRTYVPSARASSTGQPARRSDRPAVPAARRPGNVQSTPPRPYVPVARGSGNVQSTPPRPYVPVARGSGNVQSTPPRPYVPVARGSGNVQSTPPRPVAPPARVPDRASTNGHSEPRPSPARRPVPYPRVEADKDTQRPKPSANGGPTNGRATNGQARNGRATNGQPMTRRPTPGPSGDGHVANGAPKQPVPHQRPADPISRPARRPAPYPRDGGRHSSS